MSFKFESPNLPDADTMTEGFMNKAEISPLTIEEAAIPLDMYEDELLRIAEAYKAGVCPHNAGLEEPHARGENSYGAFCSEDCYEHANHEFRVKYSTPDGLESCPVDVLDTDKLDGLVGGSSQVFGQASDYLTQLRVRKWAQEQIEKAFAEGLKEAEVEGGEEEFTQTARTTEWASKVLLAEVEQKLKEAEMNEAEENNDLARSVLAWADKVLVEKGEV